MKRQRRTVFLLTLAIWARSNGTLQAVDLRNALVDYAIASWSQRDGLPPGTVWALAQDAQGYLWLGSDAGLLRFDGMEFVRWEALSATPLPQAPVQALHISRDGSLWVGFGGRGGLSRIRGPEVTNYSEREGIPWGQVTALVEDSAGTMWAGNSYGLYRFSSADERWAKWDSSAHGLPEGPVYSAHVDRQGNLLIGTADALFRRGPGQQVFERLESSKSVPSSVQIGTPDITRGTMPDSAIRGIAQDTFGRIHVTHPTAGFRILGENRAHAPFPEQGRGLRLLSDRRGNVWVATGGQGLWRVRYPSDAQAVLIEKATTLTGLVAEGAFSLLEDRAGNIWAGTAGGLNRLTPHKVTSITHLGVVAGVEATPDGSVWIDTFDGLLQISRGSGNGLQERQHLRGSRVQAMHADNDGGLWVATNRGVVRFVAGRPLPVPLTGKDTAHEIISITSDSRGSVWLWDVDDGLHRWKGGRLEAVTLPHEVRVAPIVATYADRTDRIWVVFSRGPVAVINRDGRVRVYGPDDGLEAGNYRAVYQDRDGIIWLGASNGLSRFANDRFTRVLRTGDPLAEIKAIVEDDAGALWLGTGAGILRIDRTELESVVSRGSSDIANYILYDTSDGVAGIPRWLNERSAVQAKDGRLWFVTGRGVTIVDPLTLKDPRAPATARVESAVVDGRDMRASSQVHLPPGTKSLVISYAVLNLTSPHKTRFRYRLDGFDDDWVDAGIRRQAFYTNLRPGKYRFEVIASDDVGIWNESGATWDFSIRPAFYQTTWFAVTCAATLILGAWAAWHVRLRRVREGFSLLLRERIRLSREIHDTLLQSLVGAALQCDLISSDLVSSAPASKDRILRLREQLEECIRETRQSIWNFRSSTSERNDLVTALHKAGKWATAGNGAGFDVVVSGSPYTCSAWVEQQLLRIGEEAIHNAARHAQARQIRVAVAYNGTSVTLRVSDDGRGFTCASENNGAPDHFGLTIMKERAEALGGRLRITTAIGHGTDVEAIVPASPNR